MARPCFWRKMTDHERNELDKEIRKRGYAELYGLVAWLAQRGLVVSKSALGQYANRLKKLDDSLNGTKFSPEVAAIALEFAGLTVKAITTFNRLMDVLNDSHNSH